MIFSVRPKTGLDFCIEANSIDINMLYEVEYARLVFRRSSQTTPEEPILGSNWEVQSDEPRYPGSGYTVSRLMLIQYSTVRIGQL